MFMIPAFFIGVLIGWLRAGRFGGNRLDKLQYGVAHGLALALAVLIATIAADWMGWV